MRWLAHSSERTYYETLDVVPWWFRAGQSHSGGLHQGQNRKSASLLTCLFLFLSSCAIQSTLTPSLPLGEFIDQVLEPLAEKLANERIDADKATLQTKNISPQFATFLGALFSPAGAAVGGGLATLHNDSNEQKAAQLESYRLPLKNEILALLTKRTQAKGEFMNRAPILRFPDPSIRSITFDPKTGYRERLVETGSRKP